LNLASALESAQWEVRLEQFPGGRYGWRTWERRALLRWADVAVLHQIKLSAIEARLFARFSRRRVFDFDDAIYVRKPRALGEPVHDSSWRRDKFRATCAFSQVVAAGNDVLAGAARAAARRIVILPTALDASRYKIADQSATSAPRIVWIGSPENLIYLQLLRPALARLTQTHPQLRVRIICSKFPDWPEINIERIAWSEDTEIDALAASHIGVMPLSDDEWARGKCAFKLLQYMAAGLPCVASPVGANTEAVLDGITGFHARDTAQWEGALKKLIESAPLRAQFGAAGLAHVHRRYSIEAYRSAYLQVLTELVRPASVEQRSDFRPVVGN
jgi:glycosyltransferase involved in cell wall biosynthesis